MAPKPTPTEPGCLVLRVLTPVTLFERTHCELGQPVWRIALWIDGAVWFSALAGSPHAPSLEECLKMRRKSPFAWSKYPSTHDA